MSLTLMYITNDPAVALIAEKYGVERIMVDLETLGKEERQKNMNTVKSHHCIDDVTKISSVLTTSETLVRIDPWNENSHKQVEDVISAGANRIMLPMWKTALEVESFLKAVNGRVRTTLLLETKEAVEIIDEVLENPLLDEIHIGLNDLHLSYGMTFMFELLINGVVEELCNKFQKRNLCYGFGGIARMGEGLLPAEKIVMEHYRLGSTRTILSRSFCNTEEVFEFEKIDKIFFENMRKLREFELSIIRNITSYLNSGFSDNRKCVIEIVKKIVNSKEND